jgi:histidinol dehydrogenase
MTLPQVATLPVITYTEAMDRCARRVATDPETLTRAASMIADVRERGDQAVRDYARQFGESGRIYAASELEAAAADLSTEQRALFGRVASRILAFANAQRGAFGDLTVAAGSATLSHRLAPVARAGCYVPAGSYPLPSTLLMTVVTARAAGVSEVVVCCPRPTPAILAAAAIAGASRVVALGGVQAIAAMALGLGGVPACDVVVGPGNRWVSAAKQLLSGDVRIDLPAGPSELIVVADETADVRTVAADLIAQAEHDEDALVVAIGLGGFDLAALESALKEQLGALPDTARAIGGRALSRGFCTWARARSDAVALVNAFAPEHLSVQTAAPRELVRQCEHYGAAFVGAAASEALGDYGVGPNHVLPTGGAARRYGALSVLNFLRLQTMVEAERFDASVQADCEALAVIEGLVGHARSIAVRRTAVTP